jgi:hypothetical protein
MTKSWCLNIQSMAMQKRIHPKLRIMAALTVVAILLHAVGEIRGQNPFPATGVILSSQLPPPAKIYISSPSFTILPDGGYVASHDLFGKNSNDYVSGTTKVFYSSDKGVTWTPQSTVKDMHQASLFYHNALYLFGYSKGSGDIVIRKSTDKGVTWTTPDNARNGLLKAGRFGATPNSAVVYGGRIWIAQNNSLMSAPVESNLLDADSWSYGKPIRQNPQWLGGNWTFWSEGQVVASPRTGVVLLPKTDGLPFVGLIKAASPETLAFNPDADFAAVPGAEKKFGAKYDPVSEKFYILSNPVLPAHIGRTTAQLTRTTAAVLTSKDLLHWDVEKIFLFTPNIDNGTWGEAFQYFSFDFDGDDLAIASRTSFPIGDYKPPRGHDSNLLTFHKIKNFRKTTPEHFLIADTEHDRVLRFETTQHKDAPLGDFTLGSRFAGKPLRRPTGLVQEGNGDVLIGEESGRILRFDAFGNFLGVAASTPAPPRRERLDLAPPSASRRVWVRAASNDWDEPMNWFYWGRPDTPDEIAVFGSAIDDDCTVRLNQRLTVGGLSFRNTAKYTIDGAGELALQSTAGDCLVEVLLGSHEIRVKTQLHGDLDFQAENDAALRFLGDFDLNGKTLRLRGLGAMHVGSQFQMHGGILTLDGLSPLVFDATSKPSLDGTLIFQPPESVQLTPGRSFRLLKGIERFEGVAFAGIQLPTLSSGLKWDVSKLYSEGVVGILSAQVRK